MKRHQWLALSALSISGAACSSPGWRPTLYPFHSEYESVEVSAVHSYTCLAHPDVLAPTAGECPRCGVKLVQQK